MQGKPLHFTFAYCRGWTAISSPLPLSIMRSHTTGDVERPCPSPRCCPTLNKAKENHECAEIWELMVDAAILKNLEIMDCLVPPTAMLRIHFFNTAWTANCWVCALQWARLYPSRKYPGSQPCDPGGGTTGCLNVLNGVEYI